jgi:PncC family amidohydrolase
VSAPNLTASFPDSAVLGELLARRGLTVAVAESCTGGLLGAALTAVPGSSRYVRGGVIAYADQVKRELLHVDPALLAAHGAVSREVAEAMARGVAALLDGDLGLAVTGIAGPGAEGTAKPAGLIHVAAWSAERTWHRRLEERGDREGNRAAAVRAALGAGIALLG